MKDGPMQGASRRGTTLTPIRCVQGAARGCFAMVHDPYRVLREGRAEGGGIKYEGWETTLTSIISLKGRGSNLKRGVTGTFHHVSEEHLDRYVDEFAFRYNRRDVSDGERAVMAIKGIEGKRLMYKGTKE